MAVTPGALVILDKDGTLLRDVPYNVDPARMELAPGAAEGLVMLRDQGYRVAVASDQSGVARGLFPEAALADVERRLRELMAGIGVPLAGFHYCPHHPRGEVERYRLRCTCRKPAPGLVQQALAFHGARPSESWMVGNILDDVEAGRRASCRTVLVSGGETRWLPGLFRIPDYVVSDLAAAARVIVAHDRLAAGRTRTRAE